VFYNKLRVAYNDGFRQFLDGPGWRSVPKFFVYTDVRCDHSKFDLFFVVHCFLTDNVLLPLRYLKF